MPSCGPVSALVYVSSRDSTRRFRQGTGLDVHYSSVVSFLFPELGFSSAPGSPPVSSGLLHQPRWALCKPGTHTKWYPRNGTHLNLIEIKAMHPYGTPTPTSYLPTRPSSKDEAECCTIKLFVNIQFYL